MSNKLEDLVTDAIQSFESDYDNDALYQGEPHDIINEIADGMTPTLTYNLLIMATENLNLAVDEPELGPAFDGSPTPINIIAANIYEYLTNALWEWWNETGEELYKTKVEENSE